MAWKINEEGVVELKDGNPVYIDASGAEKTVAVDTIARLNREAQEHREAKQAALAKLKEYEGLDAVKAREAIEKLAQYETQVKLDEGKLEEVKSTITRQFQTQLEEKTKAYSDLQKQHEDLLITGVFANSEYIRDNISVPRDLFEAKFRNNFRVEDNKVVVYGNDGNRLYSQERAGEFATTEEGMRILTESHPHKDSLIRANNGSGSGNPGRGGNAGGSGRYMKRSEFERLSPVEQATIATKMRSGEIQLTD